MIVGICGTNGSGKSTASEILKDIGFERMIFSDIFKEECKKRNIKPTRENLFMVSKELTEKYGKDYAAKKILEKINPEKNYCIDGFRRVEEVKAFKNLILISIDAPLKIRYERIKKRKGIKDNITFDKFKEEDEKERKNKENNINQEAVMQLAKYRIMNDSTKEKLKERILEIISENMKNFHIK